MTYNQVKYIAQKVKKILGKEWKSRVWENIGWHVEWIRGAICLSYSPSVTTPTFWCLVGEPGSGTGHIDLSIRDNAHFEDPIEAIRHACRESLKTIEKEWIPIINSVNEISLSLTTPK